MSVIKIENVTFSYPNSYDTVFENLNLQIDTDWKLGLVGRNGRGKTTLLSLLCGKYEYQGKISASVSFDYFPYQVADARRQTAEILQEICPSAPEWMLQREFSLLGADQEALYRPFETLSHGERTKALLAALFLRSDCFLLIDEPTNHLDAGARKAVSAYLQKKKGFMLVSHDRSFLDGCVDHILSLNRTGTELQSGNFSSYLAQFERQQASEAAQNERLQKDILRLRRSAERASSWADQTEASKKGALNSYLKVDRGYIGHKSAKMMKRAKCIEARRQQAIEEKSQLLKNTETTEALKLTLPQYHAAQLAAFSDVSVNYGGRTACANISFMIRRGERIALKGLNGSGKSSLLKLLAGIPVPHTGTVSIGSGLTVSYVPQDASGLCGELCSYAKEQKIDITLFLTILRKMGFERSLFEKDMSELSGGEKKKVLLAKSLCEKAHLYVWDEPLNFIDIYSRIQIERLLQEFSPTMIFAEHDIAFQAAIATKTICI